MKRLYNISEDGLDYSVSIVASTSKEAKKIAINNCPEFADSDYINIEVKWEKTKHKEIDFEKLGEGYIDNTKEVEYLLSIGVYSCLIEWECPHCKSDNEIVYFEDNKYYCSQCEEDRHEEILVEKLEKENVI